MKKELFAVFVVLLLLVTFAGCAAESNSGCGNKECGSGEDNPDSEEYCPMDCWGEEELEGE